MNRGRFSLLAGLFAGGAATMGAFVASGVTAQEDRMLRPSPNPEAIIYRDANYSGPAVSINSARSDLGLAWTVNSIRVQSGRWQLCERVNFRGTCWTFDASNPRIRLNSGRAVQSIRSLGGAAGGSGAPGTNPSLRGMAAQFFPAPATNGWRVLACESGSATANCAAATARRFCVQNGWSGSARQAMETVSGRVYLADVLCTRTGH